MSRREELLETPVDEPEMLHFKLSKLPQQLDLEGLTRSALQLFKKHPPEQLPGLVWWRLSSLSVLKTSRDVRRTTKLQEAESLLAKQTLQLRREALQRRGLAFVVRNRGSLYPVAAAFLVGAISIWLRRSGNDRHVWTFIRRTTEQWRL